jgi:hypothetical protein
VKQYFWDESKNQKLIQERGVSFEEILLAVEKGAWWISPSIPIPQNIRSKKYTLSGWKIISIWCRTWNWVKNPIDHDHSEPKGLSEIQPRRW